jgi:outer membrane protein with beta-barrel domain
MTTTTVLHRCRAAVVLLMAVFAVAVLSSRASAQTSPMDWRHGTTLSGFVGAQSASSDVNPGAGLGLGWELTRRLSFEGRGTWFGVNQEPSDFSATMAAHVALLTPRTVVPFVSAGVGMYRATVNPAWTDVPEFYRRRMSPDAPGNHTFQDFLMTFGGGVNVFVASHLALRPEANLMLVTTASDARPVAMYGLQFVYHFETHKLSQ